jgi:SAM-dependent methyltransferase
MHEHIRAFVKSAVEAFALTGPVYEFGFCAAEAAGVVPLRDCFPEAGYVGCDVCEEGEVDPREDFARLPFPDAAARTVVCVNMLSHVRDPRPTARELARLLAPGGTMLIASTLDARSWDRRLPAARLQPGLIRQLLPGLEVPLVSWQGDPEAPHTVYAAGFKPPLATAVLRGTQRFLQTFSGRLDRLANGHRRPRGLLEYALSWWNRRARQRSDFYQVEYIIDLPRGAALPEAAAAENSSGTTGTRLDLTDGG